jgi:hypothetical protein
MSGCLISPASGNNQGQVEALVPASTWQDLFDQCIFRELNTTTQASLPGDNDVLPNNSTTQKRSYFVPTALATMFFVQGKWEFALLLIIGWLITGIAISMGAAFWFDLLGRLVNVRNTGSKPEPRSSGRTDQPEKTTSQNI